MNIRFGNGNLQTLQIKCVREEAKIKPSIDNFQNRILKCLSISENMKKDLASKILLNHYLEKVILSERPCRIHKCLTQHSPPSTAPFTFNPPAWFPTHLPAGCTHTCQDCRLHTMM